jgi:exopolysaccharide biosynthesis polyprenyl glycosylphosphotransferase
MEERLRRMTALGLGTSPVVDHVPPPPHSTAPDAERSGRGVRFLLDTVARVHGASRSWPAVAADAAVLLAAAKAVHTTAYPGIVLTVVMLVGFNVGRVYAARSTLETQGVLWYPARIATPFAILALAFAEHVGRLPARPINAFNYALYGLGGLVGIRVVTWIVLTFARRSGRGLDRTIIVGRGAAARLVHERLRDHPSAGLRPVGILATGSDDDETGDGVAQGLAPDDLARVIREHAITHVVLVPEGDHDGDTAACLEACDGLDVWLSVLPPLSEMFIRPSLVTQVAGLPLIPLGKVNRTRGSLPGKRAFDLVGAAALLVLLSPVLLVTVIAMKLGQGGQLLYRQHRIGQGGRPFELLKLRSMVVGADDMAVDLAAWNASDGLLFKVRNDPRVTGVGRVLRRFSIDELPQLWNVLRGDMSLVGPRPLAVHADAFGAMDGRRHCIRPGITGYWQIAGGNGLTYAEMVKLDLAYIQNWSLWLDLRLLVRTAPALVSSQNRW